VRYSADSQQLHQC